MTRGEIITVLRRWRAGELTAKQVHDWAQSQYFPGRLDYDDEEDEESVADDVMHALDSIDMNLVIVEDVPIYLEFLATPRGQSREGYRRWREALDRVHSPERQRERQKQLAGDPFYAPFCKPYPD